MVKTLFRKLLEAHVAYKNFRVNVSSRELTVDLILLDFFIFDIILGKDSLENYRSIIDCDDKIVILCSPKRK